MKWFSQTRTYLTHNVFYYIDDTQYILKGSKSLYQCILFIIWLYVSQDRDIKGLGKRSVGKGM